MRRAVLAAWRLVAEWVGTCATADIVACDGERRVKGGREFLWAALGNHNS